MEANEHKNYTNLADSKWLQDHGIDPNTADMCYCADEQDGEYKYDSLPRPIPWRNFTANKFYVPCWSLGALIDTIPQYLQDEYGFYPLLVRSGYCGYVCENMQPHTSYKGENTMHCVLSMVKELVGCGIIGLCKDERLEKMDIHGHEETEACINDSIGEIKPA